MDTQIVVLDEAELSSCCRVCLKQPEEVLDLDAIYDEEDQLTYSNCFTLCTNIDLNEGDGIPRNLCKLCGIELQMAYDFHKKVLDATRQLKQLWRDIPHEVVITEDETQSESASRKRTRSGEESSSVENHIEMEESVEISMDDFEEHLEFEEYQSVDSLDEENNDWKAEDATRLSVVKRPTIANADATHKTALVESDPDNDEDWNFEELYNKVYEDIEDIKITKFHILQHDDNVTVRSIIANDELRRNENTVKRANDGINGHGAEGLPSSNSMTRTTYKRARVALSGPPFKCEQCDHLSPTRALLASHRHRKHRIREHSYKCTKCGKGFETVKLLERHLKRPTCHSYPEFICEYCKKKCIGLSNYNIHLRFHKKQYPFVCHLCAKTFMMSVHLNNHVKTKHENQRFICQHQNCRKLFQTSHALKTHAYVHADSMPYRCEYCFRMYPSKGRLRWHISKSHGIEHTLQDLDRMLVAEEISIKTEMVKLDLPDAPKE